MKFMKTLGAATVALMLTAGGAAAEGKLSLYHWFEYIPQELLDSAEDDEIDGRSTDSDSD